LLGAAAYGSGLALNIHSDAILRNLRTRAEVERGETSYRIPHGGGFRFVTNPQYFGELLAWLGFAAMTWSLAGVFILTLSAANLVPRAIATHRWYRERFPDYPKERRVLVPYVF
jgi:3-oxo-5-alpha-steroid 4-dehydrogenase 1